MTHAPGFTLPALAVPGGLPVGEILAAGLLATIAVVVLRRPHRYPPAVRVFVIVIGVLLAVTATQTDPMIAAALIGAAATVAVRLSRPRSREL